MPSLPFLIGADPEFTIEYQGKRIHAKNLISKLFEGQEGFCPYSGLTINNIGTLGWDGNVATGEIRPCPSKSPQKVAENIGQIISILNKKTQYLELTTINDKSPLGGHIHLDLPIGIDLTQKLRSDYKKALTMFHVPLLLGENSLNWLIRYKTNYGKLMDVRIHSKTLEWRSPTAEWILSPKLAIGTLAYWGVVWNTVKNNPTFANEEMGQYAIKNESQANCLESLMSSNWSILTSEMTKKLKNIIRQLPLYEDFKKEIEFIMNAKKVLNEKRKTNFDITVGWKMKKTETPTLKQLKNQQQVQKKFSEKNHDMDSHNMKQFTPIEYREDWNVNIFADSIQKIIIAFNWKLKNKYFLYGLPKGIENNVVKNQNNWYTGQEMINSINDFDTIEKNTPRLITQSKTTKIRDGETISVGITYKEREELKTYEIIRLISLIERNRIKPQKINKTSLLNAKPEEMTIEKMIENEKNKNDITTSAIIT